MDKIILIFGIIVLFTMLVFVIKTQLKKGKNIPLKGFERLFMGYCNITVIVIPNDVTDIFEFATGKYGIKKIISEDNLIGKFKNYNDSVLQHIGFAFPSTEHDEFKNKLIIYGEYVSKEKFGPNAYVFSNLPELTFESETCNKIYEFLKHHINCGQRLLIEVEYDDAGGRKFKI